MGVEGSRTGRAERLWLVIAVAMLWTVSVGGEAEMMQPTIQFEQLEETQASPKPATKKRRWLSCRNRGRIVLQVALLQAQPFSSGSLAAAVSPPPADSVAATSKPGFAGFAG